MTKINCRYGWAYHQKGWEGHYVIYKNFGGDFWAPITSRSSEESAEAYIKGLGDFKEHWLWGCR